MPRHEKEAEIFYVIDGSATLMTGGKLVKETRTNSTNSVARRLKVERRAPSQRRFHSRSGKHAALVQLHRWCAFPVLGACAAP